MYRLSSVKSRREYSVGLVLSDRYGRQSTVFLPNTSTTYVEPYDNNPDPVTQGASSWKHGVLKLDFTQKIDAIITIKGIGVTFMNIAFHDCLIFDF